MTQRSTQYRRPVVRVRGRHNGAVPGRLLGSTGDGAYALPRGVIVMLGLAGAVIVVAGLQSIASILAPAFLALMLTVTASPLGTWLRRKGAPGWAATLALMATVYLVLFGLGAALVVSAGRLLQLLPTYQAQFEDLANDVSTTLSSWGIDSKSISDLTSQIQPGSVAAIVEAVLGGALGLLSNAFFLLAVLLFMCLDAGNYPARLGRVAEQRPEVVYALRTFAQGTRRYLLVATIFGLIVAVIDALGLWALGVPLPLLWGLLSFITNYIPNIGFIIGLVPPALLGLLDGGPTKMLEVIALYCVVNFVIQSVIQPKVVGDAVGLSATMSFLSLVVWAWILGPLGALLAIPLSLLTKGLLVDIDPATRWVDALISASGKPADLPPDRDRDGRTRRTVPRTSR